MSRMTNEGKRTSEKINLANGILSIMRDERQIYDQKKPSLLESLHKKQDQIKSAEEKKKDRLPDNLSNRKNDVRSGR